MCVPVDLDPGEALFHEGDLGDSLYVVVRGAVAVERDGRVVARLAAGECVGETAVLDAEPRSATIVADEPAHLVRLDRNDLLDLLTDYPAIADGMASVLAQRVRTTQA